MGQTESNLGIIPGFGGTPAAAAAHRTRRGARVPDPRHADPGRRSAYRIGLVNRLSKEGETLNDAKALARQLGKRPPLATRLIIEAVDDGLEAPIDKAHRDRDARVPADRSAPRTPPRASRPSSPSASREFKGD